MQNIKTNSQVVTVTIIDLLLLAVLFYIVGGWALVGIIELIAVISLALGILVRSLIAQATAKPAVARVHRHRQN